MFVLLFPLPARRGACSLAAAAPLVYQIRILTEYSSPFPKAWRWWTRTAPRTPPGCCRCSSPTWSARAGRRGTRRRRRATTWSARVGRPGQACFACRSYMLGTWRRQRGRAATWSGRAGNGWALQCGLTRCPRLASPALSTPLSGWCTCAVVTRAAAVAHRPNRVCTLFTTTQLP